MPTYYVDGAVGADSPNDGLSEGAGNAWATIDKAVSTVAAGDIVYVKSSITYDETATITVAGTANDWITYIGYTNTPGDNGVVTITSTSGSALNSTMNQGYSSFVNFKIDGCSSHGVNAINDLAYTKWINCQFTNNGGAGCNTSSYNSFYRCYFANNTGANTNGGFDCNFVGCEFLGGGGTVIANSGTRGCTVNCLIRGFSDNQYGVNTGTNYYTTIIGDSTKTGTIGIQVNNSQNAGNCNNIITDCVTGISSTARHVVMAQNLFHNVTTHHSSTWTLVDLDDINADPLFVDTANNDYRVRQNSPAVGAGLKPGVKS